MQQSTRQQCVMIIAGEASGDLHGANLVRAMQEKKSNLFFCGIGGQAMKAAGVRIAVDASTLAVVGITEVLAKLPSLIKGMAAAKRLLKALKPDLLILIDFPDFNLRVAALAKRLGVPVLYYISPQVWAWRSGRVKKIRKLVDHVAVILPFEEEFFKSQNIPVTFVGHPLLDNRGDDFAQKPVCYPGADRTIGLLPGSRDREIARHLPVMLDAARLIRERAGNVRFIVSVAPSVEKKSIEAIISQAPDADCYETVCQGVGQIFQQSSLVIAASGTVTLQAALAGTPLVIIYKVSPLTYWLGRALIKVDSVSLVNLIAGRRVVPELLQGDATADKIADVTAEMLNDRQHLEKVISELGDVRDTLGSPGASKRVADIADKMM
ncbi:MAG: lipid-A-disaccharide synthase [Deltaproteobacteria bacterium]|nr:lipid-A-disaccharide synthase [Deltaproteobacteria bacterium]MBW2592731.1 lipid-A-disaccharide synthase [Deltaproteobacteria bacterium]